MNVYSYKTVAIMAAVFYVVLTSRITTIATNALEYKDIIVKRMKERQIQSCIQYGRGGKGSDQTNQTFNIPTTKREELAKIAAQCRWLLTYILTSIELCY